MKTLAALVIPAATVVVAFVALTSGSLPQVAVALIVGAVLFWRVAF